METTAWRVMRMGLAEGAFNMALDEAILEAVGRKESSPTLRLYAWQPPCLSLGYSQPAADADRDALAWHGWGLVRRPTGGRAILHTDELTYSVIAPLGEPRVRGSVLESYRRLSTGLMAGLERLGLPVQADEIYPQPEGAQPGGPVCFEVPSNYEITLDRKKLIGSAQSRRLGGVLQHGSLPLCGDLSRITQALVFSSEADRQAAAQRLLARATTVEGFLGRAPSWDQAADALLEGFQAALRIAFIPGEPTPGELERARQLVTEKYANEAWTGRL